MSKINTTKYNVFALLLLVVLAFGLGMPKETKAQEVNSFHIDGYGNGSYNNNGYYNNGYNNGNSLYGPQYYPYYVTPAPAPAPVDYSNAPTIYSNNGVSSNTAGTNKTVTKTTETKVVDTTDNTKTDFTGLSASAILGTNGFMPSGLVGWLALAVLILLLVILVRKITGAKDNYHATPLKHS